jgi:4-hydroxy-tetrahydrodipicolinate synthase
MTMLAGVIAAVPTPFGPDLEPDAGRFLDLCRRLLANGCDGLNICGTTGEATSLGVDQRRRLMSAAAAGLPADRLMVGTGAAALEDAVELTGLAGELGFAGALVLPPFYYKPVTEEGVAAFFGEVLGRTASVAVPIYLYHFPALTGVPFTTDLVRLLRNRHGDRIRGLKDSSGDRTWSRALASELPGFSVFPSDEGTLIDARAGVYAGCISGTANVSPAFCASAFREGDRAALDSAVRIRAVCSAGPLIPRVKAVLAATLGHEDWTRVRPPLLSVEREEAEHVVEAVRAISALDALMPEDPA